MARLFARAHAPTHRACWAAQAVLALDASPVVLQVPDFGERFWGIHVLDARTDSVARLGRVYGSPPGFYLVAGPGWVGEIPPGIRRVFGARTETAIVMPQLESGPDAAQLFDQIDVYPVAQFDAHATAGGGRWAPPAPAPDPAAPRARLRRDFRRLLPAALDGAPCLPGEGARYRQLMAVLEAARHDTQLAQVFDAEIERAEPELLAPLAAMHRFARALPHGWATLANTANFGTDYFARTLAARADPLQPLHGEVASFHLACDADGDRLDAGRRYTLTFAPGMAPPVRAFWSLAAHAADAGPAGIGGAADGRAIVSRALPAAASGGALRLHLQAAAPETAPPHHWLPLPVPDGHGFALCLRCYWPGPELLDGRWTPPAVRKAG